MDETDEPQHDSDDDEPSVDEIQHEDDEPINSDEVWYEPMPTVILQIMLDTVDHEDDDEPDEKYEAFEYVLSSYTKIP
jgi:hypothetical protein